MSDAPNSNDRFLSALMNLGDIDLAAAKRVLAHYRKIKVIVEGHGGTDITVTHGAFLDRDVIQKAAAL